MANHLCLSRTFARDVLDGGSPSISAEATGARPVGALFLAAKVDRRRASALPPSQDVKQGDHQTTTRSNQPDAGQAIVSGLPTVVAGTSAGAESPRK